MVLKTSDHPHEETAKLIYSFIDKVLMTKDIAVLGLPGGRSVEPVYKIFKETNYDWSRVHIFLVDERMVPINSDESNFKLIKESFADQLVISGLIPAENLHPFLIEGGIESYNKEFERYGGFDIILLGVGEDGHVGGLYPSHHSVTNQTKGYFTMIDSPKLPPHRMTSSRKMLQGAEYAIALFIGEGKRQALKNYLEEDIELEQCPVKIMNKIKNHYEMSDLWKM